MALILKRRWIMPSRFYITRIFVFPLFLFPIVNLFAEDLKPYPAPEDNYRRLVVRLPEIEKEDDHKVEMIITKKMLLDDINQYFFGGDLNEKSVQGWGYTYYHLSQVGPLAGTRMAVPPDAQKVERAVPVKHGIGWIRYNSKLPVVVYVPKDIDVRFRIWEAGTILNSREE